MSCSKAVRDGRNTCALWGATDPAVVGHVRGMVGMATLSLIRDPLNSNCEHDQSYRSNLQLNLPKSNSS